MASLIPGYEYDIFISYRQKDNKYDGWVTEFADNLKRELEATFKEEISVYFDMNPQDGLLGITMLGNHLRKNSGALSLFRSSRIPIVILILLPGNMSLKHLLKRLQRISSA